MVIKTFDMVHLHCFFSLNKLSILLLVLVFGTLGVLFISEATAQPATPINLSNTEVESYRPQILFKENNVYAIWQDDSVGKGDIFFSSSSNGGLSFSPVVNLSDNEGTSAFPRFAIEGNNVYATWYDYTPGLSDIFFAYSTDGGATFQARNLSQNGGVSFNPWIKTSGNNVYVVWNDDTNEINVQRESGNSIGSYDVSVVPFDILLATSHDGGSTFEITNLSNTTGDSLNSRMAVLGSNVYVVWEERNPTHDIFFTISSDNGESFKEPINLSNSNNVSKHAGIRVNDNNVHIIWLEKSSETADIFYVRSNDNGITFTKPLQLSRDAIESTYSRDTQMVVSDENVYVVWYDQNPNKSEVFFVQSSDGGATFSQPINLSENSEGASFAQIVEYDKDIYVVWNDFSLGNSEVFLRKSTDGGETFGSIENISNDKSESNIFVLGPQIALTETNAYIVFQNKSIGVNDLFLKVLNRNQDPQEELLFLQTLNGAANVEVGIDQKIEHDIPLAFNLKFLDPVTGKLLENVNYSFLIEDMQGNTIINNPNQMAATGVDIQTVTFSKIGPFNIQIEIESLGIEPPYDTKYSGKTSAVITVIPEFPLGVLAVLIVVLSMGILLGKFRTFQSIYR